MATALWPDVSTTISFRFAAGANARVDAERDRPCSRPGSARRRAHATSSDVPSSASTRARRLRALVLAGRNGDPLGGEERRRRRRLGLEQRAEREARQAGLEAVDDVEASAPRASPRFARTPMGSRPPHRGEVGTARRSRRPRDHAPLQRAPALEQVGGTRRGRDDRHGVAAAAQRLAAPRTCSLTSFGCDHENGVTRQIRSAHRARILGRARPARVGG